MKQKTFLATYLLFLVVFYISVSAVSVFMSDHNIRVLKEKSRGEYNTLSSSFSRDVMIMLVNLNQSAGGKTSALTSEKVEQSIKELSVAYSMFYRVNNLKLTVDKISAAEQKQDSRPHTIMEMQKKDNQYFIAISGNLAAPYQAYKLSYLYNITDNIQQMKNIQNKLLFICVVFSVLTGIMLHIVLSIIFKPLWVVASSSKKIADGCYDERIVIKQNNELYGVAEDFNRMAEQIENNIAKLKQEALEKQRFVDNFSHEMRTPLTSIYGYAQYMQQVALDEEGLIESTQIIMAEADHLKKLSSSLLSLTTLQDFTVKQEEVCVEKLFANVQQIVKTDLDAKNIQIVAENKLHMVKGQEDLLKSLLVNLCSNAIKACDVNDGCIHVQALQENGSPVFVVRDNGCGIPQQSLPYMTEPFYRVDKARSREEGGTGLGLSICQRIANAHHAEMEIFSVPGQGTTVTIKFSN